MSDNGDSISNLAVVLARLEDVAESQSVREQLAALREAQEKLAMTAMMHAAQLAKLREAVALVKAQKR